jgi:hypothetical protein
VRIMLEQLVIIAGLTEEQVAEKMTAKAERLARRLGVNDWAGTVAA